MAAGEVQHVTASADETVVTLTLTPAGLHVSAPTVAAADPGVAVLSVPEKLMTDDGWAVQIPVEA